MKALLHLAVHSAWHRRFALTLVVVNIALSSLLLLTIERVRTDVRTTFSSAITGTDAIVGGKSGAVQLILYSVFRIGSVTSNMRWDSVLALQQHPAVAWTIPISLGDSHRGFPVVGTDSNYFRHYRTGFARQPLKLVAGREFEGMFDVVLGADVARTLRYKVGDRIVLAHGSGALPGSDHSDHPFVVVGTLARTGTPVDRSLHISLAAMEAIHLDWFPGTGLLDRPPTHKAPTEYELTPKAVTAVLVGLKSRVAVFSFQREVARFREEALMAVMPGVALDELWQTIGYGEKALTAMSSLVAVVSLAGLVAVVLAGLNERRRELAILRSLGVRPSGMLGLLTLEGVLVTSAGLILGVAAHVALVGLLGRWVFELTGVPLTFGALTIVQWLALMAMLVAGTVASLVPAWRACVISLADGLTPTI